MKKSNLRTALHELGSDKPCAKHKKSQLVKSKPLYNKQILIDPTNKQPNTSQNPLQIVKCGELLKKCGKFGKPHLRKFSISDDEKSIIEQSPNSNKQTTYSINKIKNLVIGQQTEIFKKHQNMKAYNHLSFSLLYATSGGLYSLDLICKDEQQFHIWIRVMKYLILEKRCTSASCSIAFGDGLNRVAGKAGEPSFFTIQSMDSMGRKVTKGGDSWKVQLMLSNMKKQSAVEADVKDNEDGTYLIAYTVEKSGDYTLSVMLGDNHLQGSPFNISILPADLKLSNCVVHGIENGVAGNISTFVIEAKDRFCNRITQSIHFDVKILNDECGELIEASLLHNGDTQVTYCATRKGSYTIEVLFNKFHLPNSPFKVFVDEGETDPKHCVIKNPGSGVATQIIKCVIQAFDSFGNVCTNGDDNFVITAVKDDYSVTGSVKYVDNGTYECCIQPEWSGKYSVNITLRGEHIQNSPSILIVLPDEHESERLEQKKILEETRRKQEEEARLLNLRFEMSQKITAYTKQWASGLSFRQLLNEIAKRYYPENESILLEYGVSKEQILKTYKKLLFVIHPDQLQNASWEKKLEHEIVFNEMFTAYTNYKKWA